VDRICFPDRCESVPGRCDKNLLFLTPRKTNLDPRVVHVASGARDILALMVQLQPTDGAWD
jgi:hypothetical protein